MAASFAKGSSGLPGTSFPSGPVTCTGPGALGRSDGAGSGSLGTGSGLNTAAIRRLPAPIHEAYLTAFTNALSTVFIVAACVAAAAFLLSWALEQRPLRETVTASTGIGESFAAPKLTDSLAEASRAMSVIIGREGRRQLVARLVTDLPSSYVLLSNTLAELQAQLPPGLVRTDRQPGDPPEVVEIWFPAAA